jgi:hypothetical protein
MALTGIAPPTAAASRKKRLATEVRRMGDDKKGEALAEAVRFELTDGCPSPVFKTGALNRSATPPAKAEE